MKMGINSRNSLQGTNGGLLGANKREVKKGGKDFLKGHDQEFKRGGG